MMEIDCCAKKDHSKHFICSLYSGKGSQAAAPHKFFYLELRVHANEESGMM